MIPFFCKPVMNITSLFNRELAVIFVHFAIKKNDFVFTDKIVPILFIYRLI